MIYPAYRFRWEVYNDTLRAHLTKETIWLDIGCGTNEHVAEFSRLTKEAIGIDVLDYANRANAPFLKADLRNIPLPDSFANLITLRMVVEHLEKVPEDFAEIDRLLAPGGTMLILTTNIWSPIVFLPLLLPFPLRKRIIQTFFHVTDEEVFQTYHRFNSPARIRKGVLTLRLSSLMCLEQVPFHNPFLTIIFGLWYSVVQLTALRFFRSNMLAVLRKP